MVARTVKEGRGLENAFKVFDEVSSGTRSAIELQLCAWQDSAFEVEIIHVRAQESLPKTSCGYLRTELSPFFDTPGSGCGDFCIHTAKVAK